MSQRNPFVVDQLRPEGMGGKSGGVYQITASSASPTRIIGRDELGLPLEDTVPSVHHRSMVHPSGSVQKVPLRTASVFSNEVEAQRYEQLVLTDLISAGWIPLDMCPYSTEWTHLTHGPFVKIKSGERACSGDKGGCRHMQAVIEERTERTRAQHAASQKRLESMSTDDVERMQKAHVEALGEVLARHLPPQTQIQAAVPAANLARLRDGQGEPERQGDNQVKG